jgi:transposase|tara:strand:- start:603 stop:887 length:285 start_codon:yes stop_codon:yes gene_type:complete
MARNKRHDINFVEYFNQRRQKDISKHGEDDTSAGLRDTREIADYFDISLATARATLSRMAELGIVTCYAPIDGRTNIWGLTEYSSESTVEDTSS